MQIRASFHLQKSKHKEIPYKLKVIPCLKNWMEVQGAGNLKVPSNKSWTSLFDSSSSDPKLQFHEPILCNNKKLIRIPKATHDLGKTVWKDSLIGQFFCSAPKHHQVKL